MCWECYWCWRGNHILTFTWVKLSLLRRSFHSMYFIKHFQYKKQYKNSIIEFLACWCQIGDMLLWRPFSTYWVVNDLSFIHWGCHKTIFSPELHNLHSNYIAYMHSWTSYNTWNACLYVVTQPVNNIVPQSSLPLFNDPGTLFHQATSVTIWDNCLLTLYRWQSFLQKYTHSRKKNLTHLGNQIHMSLKCFVLYMLSLYLYKPTHHMPTARWWITTIGVLNRPNWL